MRIGILHSSSLPDANIEALRSGLRQRGFVEGRHLIIEYRAADGKLERLPELATDLVRAKVDVIVTGRTAAIRAARDATTTIPIVFAGGADPVGTGLVASLARPGGNVTGVTTINVELTPKRLELLKETRSRSSSELLNSSRTAITVILRSDRVESWTQDQVEIGARGRDS